MVRTVMTSPTLNEAAQYGADFVRGMKVVEANKIALHVSGTASIDEQGRTAHVGDLEAQADRMFVNIAALLAGQGAGFGDVVSAITYLKHPADAARLRERIRAAGFEGFPHALVEAPICRPDLLCETEALAVAAARSVGALKRLADEVLQLLFAKVRHRPAIDEVLRCRRDFQRHCIVAVLLHALRDFGCIHVGHQLFDIQTDACNRRPYQLRSSGVIRRPLGLRGQQRLQGLPVLVLLATRFQDSDDVVGAVVKGQVANRQADPVRVLRHPLLDQREELGAGLARRIEELDDMYPGACVAQRRGVGARERCLRRRSGDIRGRGRTP